MENLNFKVKIAEKWQRDSFGHLKKYCYLPVLVKKNDNLCPNLLGILNEHIHVLLTSDPGLSLFNVEDRGDYYFLKTRFQIDTVLEVSDFDKDVYELNNSDNPHFGLPTPRGIETYISKGQWEIIGAPSVFDVRIKSTIQIEADDNDICNLHVFVVDKFIEIPFDSASILSVSNGERADLYVINTNNDFYNSQFNYPCSVKVDEWEKS